MANECAVCKQPAIVYARVTRGEQKANVFLCESCVHRLSRKSTVQLLDSTTPALPVHSFIGPTEGTADLHQSKPTTDYAQPAAESSQEESAQKSTTNKWKRAFFGLLAAFVVVESLTLAHFLSPHNLGQLFKRDSKATSAIESLLDESKNNAKELSIGDSIQTDDWIITVTRADISKYLNGDQESPDYLNTTNKSTYTEYGNYGVRLRERDNITCPDDQIIISATISVQFLGKREQSFGCNIEVEYGDGYIVSSRYNNLYQRFGERFYSDKMPFQPLDPPGEYRWYDSIPVVVQENTDVPLWIVFRSFDGADYYYRIR